MFDKKMMIILTICLVSLLSLSVVTAADNSTDDVVCLDSADDGLNINENQVLEISENSEILQSDSGSFSDLQKIFDKAHNQSVITLDKDYIFNEETDDASGVKITNLLSTIDGNGHTIDGNSKSRIFNIINSNITFKNFNFKNAYTDGNGGAILGNCTADNCTFRYNTAANGGGMYGGSAISCTFEDNSAQNGSGMYNGYAEYSTFEHNYADNAGGGMYGGSALNCTFSRNGAMTGGAVYDCNTTHCTINDDNYDGLKSGTFSDLDNIIDDADSGSTIVLDRNYENIDGFDVSGIEIDKNLIIDGQGHRIDARGISRIFVLEKKKESITFEVRNVIFVNAEYSEHITYINLEYGAVINSYSDDNHVTAINCSFINNHASRGAGAMYLGTAINCTFIGNRGYDCGATYGVDAKLCVFYDNGVCTMHKGSRFLCIIDGDCSETEVIVPTLSMSGDTASAIGSKLTFKLTYDNVEYTGQKVTIDIYENSKVKESYESTTGSSWAIPFVGQYNYKIYLKDYPEVNTIEGSFSVTSNVYISNYKFTSKYRHDDNLTVYCNDNLNNPVPYITVSVDFNGVTDYTTDNQGRIFVPISDLAPGEYDISISFAGNSYYHSSSSKIHLSLVKGVVKLVPSSLVTTYSSDDYLLLTLYDFKNNFISNATISVDLNGTKNYTTDENGQVNVSTKNLTPGTHFINVTFIGNNYYEKLNITAKVVINKITTKLTSNSVSTFYNTENKLVIYLFDMFGNPLSDATVSVDLNGTEKYVTDKKGCIYVSTKDLTPNVYSAKISFAGDNIYQKSNITCEVIVKYYPSQLIANDLISDYGSDDEWIITLVDGEGIPISGESVSFAFAGNKYTTDENGKIILSPNLNEGWIISLIDSKGNPVSDIPVYINENAGINYTTDKNGQIKFKIKNLIPGTYTVNTVFSGNGLYSQVKALNKIVVSKATSKLIANVSDDALLVTLTDNNANPISNTTVSIDLNGTKNYTTDKKGNIKVSIKDLIPNNYVANITFKENELYLSSNTLTNINVNKLNTEFIFNYTGENLVVSLVDASGDPVSYVPVVVDLNGGKEYVTDGDGKFSIVVKSLIPDTYVVGATFDGNEFYLKSSASTNITVSKMDTEFVFNYTGEDLVVSLLDAFGCPVSYVPVVVDLNGSKEYSTDVDGKFSVVVKGLFPDTYVVDVTFEGNELYLKSNATTNIVVDKKTPEIVINSGAGDLVKYYMGSERLIVALNNNDGNPLADSLIFIKINNVEYNRTTDENGEASMALNLAKGNYTALVSYNGNDYYTPLNATANVIIKSTIIGEDVTKIEKASKPYSASFLDSEGYPLYDENVVQFNINGVIYNRTITDGVGKLNLNLAAGEYIITAINPVNGEMSSNKITILPRLVENSDITKYFRNATQYTLKVLGDDGEALGAGVNVTFNINGMLYTRQTNESGMVKMNINLAPGEYVITAEYEGCRVSNNITVLSVLNATDLTKKYNESDSFVVTLVDASGNKYANQNLTFNINGVFYNKTTDSEGNAKLNINLMAGEYIITSMYESAMISNKVTVKA